MNDASVFAGMYQDNSLVIGNLLGKNFLLDSLNDNLSVGDVIDANQILAEHLYGTHIADIVKSKDVQKIKDLHNVVSKKLVSIKENFDGFDFYNIALVLIRPEVYHTLPRCISFFQSIGLEIILKKTITISFEQYMNMYFDGMVHPDSYNDFPTRTLNYINKPVHVLILRRKESESPYSLSDYISINYRGKQGQNASNTLRGDIVYNTLKEFTSNNGRGLVKETRIALDPIGAYRALATDKINSDKMHNQVDIPILFYAGQGIHIPKYEELTRDISVLCDISEIKDAILLKGSKND